jgi:hypothetical protein
MKRFATVLLLVAGLASPALAGPIGTIGQVSVTTLTGFYNGSVGAGEFAAYGYGSSLTNEAYILDPLSPPTGNIGNFDPSFQTFCLEHNEGSANPAFFVVGSGTVMEGDVVADPISQGTAWLYAQFARGVLADYFTASRLANAVLLQNAIWALENPAFGTPVGNPYYDAALLNGGTTPAPVGFAGVYTLINFDSAAHRDAFVQGGPAVGSRQDYLYFVPDGGATLMLLGGALMGLGALRRKFRR